MACRNRGTEIRAEREIREKVKLLVGEKSKKAQSVPSFHQGLRVALSSKHRIYTTCTLHMGGHGACGITVSQRCDYMVENSAKVSHIWGEGLGICKWENVSGACWSEAKQWTLCKGPCTSARCPGVDLLLRGFNT